MSISDCTISSKRKKLSRDSILIFVYISIYKTKNVALEDKTFMIGIRNICETGIWLMKKMKMLGGRGGRFLWVSATLCTSEPNDERSGLNLLQVLRWRWFFTWGVQKIGESHRKISNICCGGILKLSTWLST